MCPSQSFRSCADVKIVQSSSTTDTYVPNPVKPITTSYAKVFSCKGAGIEYGLTLDVKKYPHAILVVLIVWHLTKFVLQIAFVDGFQEKLIFIEYQLTGPINYF